MGTGVDLSVTPNYFFVSGNEPLLSMDFANTWRSVDGDYPVLAPVFLGMVGWGNCGSHGSDAPFAGGLGTYETPYLICTATQLQAIGNSATRLQADYKLMSDIDLSSYTGTMFAIIGNSTTPFKGTFRGEGHSLTNFTYNTTASDIGVFGRADHGLFSRVGLPNANVAAVSTVGALLSSGISSQVVASFSRAPKGTVYVFTFFPRKT